jgi:DNA-binding MarR family transcriptional regulator
MLLDDEQLDVDPIVREQQSHDGSLHIVRRLRRAFLSLSRCGDAVFSPYRLTTEQYSLMRSVQRNPGIRQTEITDMIFAEPNTVTAMVTLLEKRGILRRKPSPTDGRVRQLFLTAHGQKVMNRLSSDWQPMRDVLRNCFTGDAGQQALEILDNVFNEMQREREKFLGTPSHDHTAQTEADERVVANASLSKAATRGKMDRAIKPLTLPASKTEARSRTNRGSGVRVTPS